MNEMKKVSAAWRGAVLNVAALMGFAALTGCGDSPPRRADEAGCVGDSRDSPLVVGGTATPTYVRLSAGEIAAIGAIARDGEPHCSGYLVNPRWVVTAQHCTNKSSPPASPEELEFLIGQEPFRDGGGVAAIKINRFLSHPELDLSLLELEEDATIQVPGITPLPVAFEGFNIKNGMDVEAAGFGAIAAERISDDLYRTIGAGSRGFSRQRVTRVTPGAIAIEGGGDRGLCGGDSGGPMFVRSADGSGRVIGTLAQGSSNCVGRDSFVRNDVLRDWIETYTGPLSTESNDQCGLAGAMGECVERTVVRCERGLLLTEECTDDRVCGWDRSAGRFGCVLPFEDPCGGVDFVGECDGNIAVWCDRGEIRRRDCSTCDQRQTCGLVRERGGFYCHVNECGSIGPTGRCNRNTLELCTAGQVTRVDCGESNAICDWIDDNTGFGCRDL